MWIENIEWWKTIEESNKLLLRYLRVFASSPPFDLSLPFQILISECSFLSKFFSILSISFFYMYIFLYFLLILFWSAMNTCQVNILIWRWWRGVRHISMMTKQMFRYICVPNNERTEKMWGKQKRNVLKRRMEERQ